MCTINYSKADSYMVTGEKIMILKGNEHHIKHWQNLSTATLIKITNGCKLPMATVIVGTHGNMLPMTTLIEVTHGNMDTSYLWPMATVIVVIDTSYQWQQW